MTELIISKKIVRILISLFLILISESINSQPLPNNFSVGTCLEIFSNDSVRIYFICAGGIVEKRCADYVRIGRLDSLYNNVSGVFSDFYISGEIAFKCKMKKGKLNGIGTYFYRNGKVSEVGLYSNNIRVGEWRYFYPNGRPEKTFLFIDGEPLVIEYYNRDGIEKVKNGEGYYTGFFVGHNGCFPFMISGKISEGKRDSIWTFSLTSNEVWDKGRFISGSTYTMNNKKYPMMRLQGYVGNENVIIEENSIGCPGDRFFPAQYKGGSMNVSFYPKLENGIKKSLNYKIEDQWILVCVEIDNNDKLKSIYVHSSLDDTRIEKIIYDLIYKLKNGWKTEIMNQNKIETSFLFPIIVEDSKIQIQALY